MTTQYSSDMSVCVSVCVTERYGLQHNTSVTCLCVYVTERYGGQHSTSLTCLSVSVCVIERYG